MLLLLLVLSLGACTGEEPEKAEREPAVPAGAIMQPRVLLVHSYHFNYPWTRGINQAVASYFNLQLDHSGHVVSDQPGPVELKIVYMDTKRRTDTEFIRAAALKAKDVIDQWKPEVVIISDDNAAKYLVLPYYHSSPLSIVFCGINWSADEYNFSAANITGMVEVQLVDQLVEIMKIYSKGERVAFLKGDDPSARKEAGFYEKNYGLRLDKRFVRSYADWKSEFLRLQQEADMILLGNTATIADWDKEAALRFVRANTSVPTGNWDKWMAPYSLITVATKPEEQGRWAAEQAMRIVQGVSPGDIPITKNREAQVYLNMSIANAMDIVFPMELVNQAIFVH